MTEPSTGGLIYMRARWMDPLTGRFISEDPAGDGTNWYVYCGDNPVNAVDPTGHFVELDVLLSMGIVIDQWLSTFVDIIASGVYESGNGSFNAYWRFNLDDDLYELRLDFSGHQGSDVHLNFGKLGDSAHEFIPLENMDQVWDLVFAIIEGTI